MLLVLITDQLVIVGQLGKKVYLQRIRLFLRSKGQYVGRKWFGR